MNYTDFAKIAHVSRNGAVKRAALIWQEAPKELDEDQAKELLQSFKDYPSRASVLSFEERAFYQNVYELMKEKGGMTRDEIGSIFGRKSIDSILTVFDKMNLLVYEEDSGGIVRAYTD